MSRTVKCDICEDEMPYEGAQQAERTIFLRGKQGGQIELFLSIIPSIQDGSDICHKCIINALQGVDKKNVREEGEVAQCGHERVGYVEAGQRDSGNPYAIYTVCDANGCIEDYKARATRISGQQSYFYRDTIGGS